MLFGELPWAMTKMKDYVSAEDYTHTCTLSKIGKYGLLAESSFHLLQATFLKAQFSFSHEELLLPGASSQEVESSKACYVLFVAKVANFIRLSSELRHCQNKMSSLMEKVSMPSSPAILVDRVTKIKGLLKKEKKGYLELELILEASYRQTTVGSFR